jgi:hypothetical protein
VEVKPLKGLKLKGTARVVLKTFSLDCQNFQIDLSTYLLRKSKKEKDVFCFETVSPQEPSTIRLQVIANSPDAERALTNMGFSMFRQFLEASNKIESSAKVEIKLLKQRQPPSERGTPKNQSSVGLENYEFSKEELKPVTSGEAEESGKSLIEELVGKETEEDANEEVYEYLERKVEEARREFALGKMGRVHKNRLSLLLPPNFNLGDLYAYGDYVPEAKLGERGLVIYHSKKHNSFKLELVVKGEMERVLRVLCEVQNEKLWNRAVNESQAKWAITSENAYIFYRKQKSINEWFRERDFLFIRYLFRQGAAHFIIDRSIDNPHFIPFQSIQRGRIDHCIIKVQKELEGVSVLIDFKADYAGLLTSELKKTMALSYLREYAHLQEFLAAFSSPTTTNAYDYDWQIDEVSNNRNNESFASISSVVFEEPLEDLCSKLSDEESFYSIVDEPVQFEVTQREHDERQREQNERRRAAEGRQEGD